jgi:hypothetical protein
MDANETQRNDRELKDAIQFYLDKELTILENALPYYEEVYDNTSINNVEMFTAIKNMKWQIGFLTSVVGNYPNKDTYHGNIAAFLSPDDARRVKDKLFDKLP